MELTGTDYPRRKVPTKEKVRIGTCCAVRVAEASTIMSDADAAFFTENPFGDKSTVSLFNLDEFQALEKRPDVSNKPFYQCPFGAETAKPSLGQTNLNIELPNACPHPTTWWRIPSTGRSYRTPHAHMRAEMCTIP